MSVSIETDGELAVRVPELLLAGKFIVPNRGRQVYDISPDGQRFLLAPMGWDPRDPRTHDREYMFNWFRRHMEEVERAIAPERLLIFQVSEDWESLCEFLGVDVPKTTFPHVNTTEQFLKMVKTGEVPQRSS